MTSKKEISSNPNSTSEFFKAVVCLTFLWLFTNKFIFSNELVKLTPVIQTASGPVQGHVAYSRDNQKYWQFLGIPYAKPPVGHRKFAPPEPIEPWNSTKQVHSYAPSCARFDILNSYKPTGQLDCLYLNVFVNVENGFKTSAPKPVVVYIHGGGWVTGWTEVQQPDYFMDQNIVLVTMAYRLGPYGFLNLKGVPGAPEGNMAMLDMILSLKWVQQNIANFGGDPNRVTLFAESAGAISGELLLLSPVSQGLFHKAILHSNSAFGAYAITKDQRKLATNYAKRMGCTVNNLDDVWLCFQNSDSETVVKYQHMLINPILPKDLFQSTLDGYVVPDMPEKLVKMENFTKIPVMIGMNSDEGSLRVPRFEAMPESLLKLDENWNELFGNAIVVNEPTTVHLAEKVRKRYFGNKKLTEDLTSARRNLSLLLSEMGFFYPAHKSAVLYAKAGAPVYMYYYNYTSRIYPGSYSTFKATRLDDWLPGVVKIFWFVTIDWISEYVFGGVGTRPHGIAHGENMFQTWNLLGLSKFLSGWDADFSRSFIKAYTDFANDTLPLRFREVQWPTINQHVNSGQDEFSMPYMLMDNKDVPNVIPEPFGKSIEFWSKMEDWEWEYK